MKRIQQLHLWLGTLFAPLIIFFSLSGAFQTLGWHELEKGGQKTPAWIAQLAAVHKHQAVQSGEGGPRRRPPKGASATQRPEAKRAVQAQNGPSPWPLKIFVVLMSLGLFFTTTLGIWMAFKYSSKKKSVVWALLIVGTVLPIALLWL